MNDFIHAFILYPNRNKLHYYYYLPDEEPEINDNVQVMEYAIKGSMVKLIHQ